MSPKKTAPPGVPAAEETEELPPLLQVKDRERLRQLFKSSLLETIEKLVIVEINPLIPDKVLDTLGALHRLREDLRKEDSFSIRIDHEHGVVISNGRYQFHI